MNYVHISSPLPEVSPRRRAVELLGRMFFVTLTVSFAAMVYGFTTMVHF